MTDEHVHAVPVNKLVHPTANLSTLATRMIHQSKRKTSYVEGQTHQDHQHKAPDNIHEATQPMVDVPHTT